MAIVAAVPQHLFWRLLRECTREPGRLALALVALLSSSGAQLTLTWLVKLWVEGPLAGERGDGNWLAVAAVVTTAVLVVALLASRYTLNSVNQRVVQRLRDAAQARLLEMTAPAYRRYHSGDLIARFIADAEQLSGFLRDVLRRLIGESVVICGAVAIMCYLEWRLALATCAVLPFVALTLDRLGRVIRRRSLSAQIEAGALTAALKEQLGGWTTIKTFQTERFEQARFRQRTAAYGRAVMRGEWISGLLAAIVFLVTGVGLLVVVDYGTRLVVRGEMTTGSLVAFGLYLLQTIEPLRRLGDVQALLQRMLAAATRLYVIIDAPEVERTDLPDSTELPSVMPAKAGIQAGGRRGMDPRLREDDLSRFIGDGGVPRPVGLSIEQVGFRYRAEEAVLVEIELHLAARERVALVGASGGGKSTLAALILRLVDPASGRILLDGVDLRVLPLGVLRRTVCLVEQEPFIFGGALLDNLRYGSWQASRAAVDTAVTLAGLGSVVAALPQGLDGVLEEGGRNLSVGQKQRIALARAVIRDPGLLILDEATSALDSETEAQIFTRLEGWLARRTVVAIAHRLATVARFHRVIVLDGGRVVGDGAVGELVRRCPAFRALFADQLVAWEAPPPSVVWH